MSFPKYIANFNTTMQYC